MRQGCFLSPPLLNLYSEEAIIEIKAVHLCNDRFSSGFSGITCERTTKDFLMMFTIFCFFMIQYST